MEFVTNNPIDTLAAKLADNMNDFAYDHWRCLIDGGEVYIDPEGELERAYERVTGEDIPENMYEPLLDHPLIRKAVKDMEVCVLDHALDADAVRVSYTGGLYGMMRENGMSIRDFI